MTTGVLKLSDYKSSTRPTWCPGCGDFGVLSSLQKASLELGLSPDNIAVVAGIGCSSNLPHFMSAYGAHTLHGRALVFATGVKLANPELKVIATTGDGDGFGIGGNHFIHACRRNVNIVHVAMNNSIYGLTVGQASPTTWEGEITKSTPSGYTVHEMPLKPAAVALAAGATFVARTFAGHGDQQKEIFIEALQHKGFAFVDSLSPCVTYQKSATYEYYREHTYDLSDQGHNPKDIGAAMQQALKGSRGGEWPVGVFYSQERPIYEDFEPAYEQGPLPMRELGLKNDDPILNRFY